MAAPKYKGKLIPRTVIKLGEHKGKKYFSRVIEPVRVVLGLPEVKATDLETKKGEVVYVKRGSLNAKQYTVLTNKQTPKKKPVTVSLPVPDAFPMYKVKRLLQGKTNLKGLRTPLGVTHSL